MIGKRLAIGTYLLLALFTLVFVGPALSQGEDNLPPAKEDIVKSYCAILGAKTRAELSASVDDLFAIARDMVVESLEIKGVDQSWAISVRSLRHDLLQANEDQLDGDRTKIETLTGEFKPSLTDSVCEWARLLGEDDTNQANNYARWEVVGNITKIGQSVETDFYQNVLKQLKNLAETKIPELTEEEKEKKLEGTLEDVTVCREGCEFSELEKAVSAIKPGGIITIEAGVYDVNTTIEKDLTVKGAGKEEVKLQGKEEGHPVLTVGSSAVVKLFDLTVQFAIENEGDDSCASKAKGICPHGITAKAGSRLELTGVSIYGNWKGIRLTNNAKAVVKNSTIHRNRYYGFHLTENSSLEVTGSTISEGSVGAYLEDYAVAEIRDSTMKDFGNGFFLWDGSSATVKNCRLARMEFGAFLNNRAKIKLLDNEVIKVESFTFNTPMFFNGEIEKSGNTFTMEEKEEGEEQPEQGPQLEILDWELSRGDNWVWVKGKAKNVSGSSLIIAGVKGLFYDGQGNLVTTMTATTVGLGDGEVWGFEISAYVDPNRVDKVEVVEGESSEGPF